MCVCVGGASDLSELNIRTMKTIVRDYLCFAWLHRLHRNPKPQGVVQSECYSAIARHAKSRTTTLASLPEIELLSCN